MTDSELWFTRATLRRDAPDLAPLLGRLLPADGDEGEKLNAAHQLLWTLMPETMQRSGKPSRPDGGDKAAFLWRATERPNSWYLLGPMPRADSSFFDVEFKPYRLSLQAGDRLSFDLVVHATVNRLIEPEKGRAGRKRCDIVIDALKAEERAGEGSDTRAMRRQATAEAALAAWLAQQGERNGFHLEGFDLIAYRTPPLNRRRVGQGRQKLADNAPLMGIGHCRGLLTVKDPAAFAAKVTCGFGRAKAFGCGLMLLRRAG